MKYVFGSREITCVICSKKETATGQNQLYCEGCRIIVNKGHVKAFNKKRRQDNIWKTCTECSQVVKEVGMKHRCRSCIHKEHFKKDSPKLCKRCDKVEIPTGKVYCPDCKRTTQLENMRANYALHKTKRLCRRCKKSIDHIPSAQRYCSDECRVCKPKKEVLKPTKKVIKDDLLWEEQTSQMQPRKKAEEVEINPFFLQKRGSGRK